MLFRITSDILPDLKQVNHHISFNFHYIKWYIWKQISNKASEISDGGAERLISVQTVTFCTEIFASSISVYVICHPVFQTRQD